MLKIKSLIKVYVAVFFNRNSISKFLLANTVLNRLDAISLR